MNNKGFALTETLVVVVFLISIFTFIYVSIIPLIGKYENAINTEKDIDIVYKLYHVRKLIMGDANKNTVTDSEVESINCSNLNKSTLCSKLMEQLELRESNIDNYVIIYAKSLNATNIATIKTINSEIGDYADKYKNNIAAETLFLLDTKKHTVSHLNYSTAPICKRATVLHGEACTNSSTSYYCQGAGYGLNTVITYGKTGTVGTLDVGDAFDCDVNGNGVYDERFYYLGDYYDTNTKTFDTSTGILIYYSDTVNGEATQIILNATSKYHTTDNWHGPVSALADLPTTTQWSNITLKNTARTIYACDDANCSNEYLTTSGGTITPNPFSYTGRAARLLTIEELYHSGCGTSPVLKKCNFLFERTKYADSGFLVYGPRLENPIYSDSETAWWLTSYSRLVAGLNSAHPVTSTSFGIRPVIEIPKTKISY